jgi:hypothetical protein
MFGSIVKHSLLELNKKEVKPMFATIIEPAEFSWDTQSGSCICFGGSPGGNCICFGWSPGASYFDVLR